MRNKLRGLLAVLGLVLGSFFIPTGGSAGAVTTVCPGSPTGNGWFDTYNINNGRHGAINCTIDGNHIVLDMRAYYNGVLYEAKGAVDIWFPWYCHVGAGSFVNGTNYANPFTIYFAHHNGVYGCGQNMLIYQNGNQFTQGPWFSGLGNYYNEFRAGGQNNLWADNGAGSHYLDSGGWNDTLPFVQERITASGNPNMGNLFSIVSVYPGA